VWRLHIIRNNQPTEMGTRWVRSGRAILGVVLTKYNMEGPCRKIRRNGKKRSQWKVEYVALGLMTDLEEEIQREIHVAHVRGRGLPLRR
jgi:hypothetical protein